MIKINKIEKHFIAASIAWFIFAFIIGISMNYPYLVMTISLIWLLPLLINILLMSFIKIRYTVGENSIDNITFIQLFGFVDCILLSLSPGYSWGIILSLAKRDYNHINESFLSFADDKNEYAMSKIKKFI